MGDALRRAKELLFLGFFGLGNKGGGVLPWLFVPGDVGDCAPDLSTDKLGPDWSGLLAAAPLPNEPGDGNLNDKLIVLEDFRTPLELGDVALLLGDGSEERAKQPVGLADLVLSLPVDSDA